MGACESSNEKTSHKTPFTQQSITNQIPKRQEYYKIMDFEYDDKSSLNSYCGSNSTKSNLEELSKNLKPELAKYEPSLHKLRNSKTNQSCASSHLTDEEIIVQGKINLECQNKDEDFDNNSFKNLVQKQGGIVIKDFDKNSKNTSNLEIISEIPPKLISNKILNDIMTELNYKNNNIENNFNNYQMKNNYQGEYFNGYRGRKLASLKDFM